MTDEQIEQVLKILIPEKKPEIQSEMDESFDENDEDDQKMPEMPEKPDDMEID